MKFNKFMSIREDEFRNPRLDRIGWMDRYGKFYPLRFNSDTHSALICILLDGKYEEDLYREAYDQGWVRIIPYGSDTLSASTESQHGLTSAQLDTLKDMAIKHGFDKVKFENLKDFRTVWSEIEESTSKNSRLKQIADVNSRDGVFWRVQHSKETLPTKSRDLWSSSDDEYYSDGRVSFYANLSNAVRDFAGKQNDAWGNVSDHIRDEGTDVPVLVAAVSDYEIVDAPESEVILIKPKEIFRIVPTDEEIDFLLHADWMNESIESIEIIRSKKTEKDFSAWFIPDGKIFIMFPHAMHDKIMESIYDARMNNKKFQFEDFSKADCDRIDEIITPIDKKSFNVVKKASRLNRCGELTNVFFRRNWVRVNFNNLEKESSVSNWFGASNEDIESSILLIKKFINGIISPEYLRVMIHAGKLATNFMMSNAGSFIAGLGKSIDTSRGRMFGAANAFIGECKRIDEAFDSLEVIRSKSTTGSFSAWFIPNINAVMMFPYAFHWRFMSGVKTARTMNRKFRLPTSNPNPFTEFSEADCDRIDEIISSIDPELFDAVENASSDNSFEEMNNVFYGLGWVRLNFNKTNSGGAIANKLGIADSDIKTAVRFMKERTSGIVPPGNLQIIVENGTSVVAFIMSQVDSFLARIGKTADTARGRMFGMSNAFIGENARMYESFKMFYESEKIKLSKIYTYSELMDEHELLGRYIHSGDVDVELPVKTKSPEELKNVTMIDHKTKILDSFKDATNKQKKTVDEKMQDFDDDRIVVLYKNAVIDGHHHIVAAIKLGKPVRYVNLIDLGD